MSNSKKKVAALQLASGSNVSANLLETERLAEAAAKQGAKLIVLPENFAFMGRSCGDANALREAPGDGPLQSFLSQLAHRLGVWLVGGTIPLEADHAAKWRAACTVYDEHGKQVARYDKQHLFDVNLIESDEQFVESESIEPGDRVLVIDSPIGRLGIAVCYDLRFPELFRAMVDRRVEVIALPAAFTAITGRAHWETLVRARAIENLSYVIASAQGGFHVASRETYGHSMIVDPWGTKLALRERGNGCVVAEIDPEFQHTTRRNFPCLDHRRLHCR
ncbi:MAG: carbon-nitrogen hydrolase family protein [Gammaproteobacteria bacterium]|nr:carbon-nitrogen hydrolase family protein [Gammaproteobacteria bacterium]MCP5318406.1 carbon-nitrogen hydrolase family protein [Chromatiaceae bacterium]MCW5586936.1 carbon-nitrogen hydrolase family protein [Chromatiales bacterium]MCB1816872.1 carbon-nitrogen hydrolase family protein [Gammaproteobacteria bacterium]HOP16487.1 carbon-nitrogen hydrolase family protein [Gammaproteobacteria bacterium]